MTSRFYEKRLLRAAPLITFLGVLTLGTWCVLLWIDGGKRGYLYTGDSNILVQGTHEALRCLSHKTLTRCAMVGSDSAVGPYAPLQYIPAFLLLGVLRVGDLHALQLLARLSTLAFFATIAMVAVPFRRNRNLWPIAVVSVVGSALAFQSTSAFGEMLAAFMMLAAVLADATARKIARTTRRPKYWIA